MRRIDVIKGDKFKHYKNNKIYEIVDFCLMQIQDEWISAVIYSEVNNQQKYTRSIVEFSNKFTKV